jgi:DNA-binding NarL/FixJ family response regulator
MKSNETGMVHVWLIEDDAGYRKCLKETLIASPEIGQVDLFSSCTSALAALKREVLPDVFLIDLGLPKISGLVGIERIRKITQEIPIVVLTVYEEKEKVLSALKSGAAGYLLKTASGKEIATGVLQAVRGEVPLNPKIAVHLLDGLKVQSYEDLLADITDRERDVLRNMANGLSVKQNADKLGLSKYTIDFHMRKIYKKLGVGTQTEAIAKAARAGLI